MCVKELKLMKQKFHQLRINTNEITTLLIEELPTEPCLGQSVTYWRQKTEVSDDKTSDRMSKCSSSAKLTLAFSAWTLLVGYQEEHPPCKN